MKEFLKNIDAPLATGIFFSLFAVVLSVEFKKTKLRDYIFTITLSVLATWCAIDTWLKHASLLYHCMVGFAVGFIANDVCINLKLTVPDFIKKVIEVTLEAIGRWLDKFIDRK